MVSDDGQDFLCMRVVSQHPIQMKSGEVGYIHQFGERPKEFTPYRKPVRTPEINAGAIISKWRSATSAKQLSVYASELGVKASALMELRVAWSCEHGAWGWPMRNGEGCIVGIRLRWPDGKKKCVTGSHNALFWPFCIPQKTLWVVEGGTDCAAALSIGLFAIGRPSCSGGLFDLQASIKKLGVERAVIIADNDDDKEMPDGSKYNPGIDGGTNLAGRLGILCCVVSLPCKDVREGVRLGMTAEDVENLAQGTLWHTLKTTNQTKSSLS
jgi:hypothetical protein